MMLLRPFCGNKKIKKPIVSWEILVICVRFHPPTPPLLLPMKYLKLQSIKSRMGRAIRRRKACVRGWHHSFFRYLLKRLNMEGKSRCSSEIRSPTNRIPDTVLLKLGLTHFGTVWNSFSQKDQFSKGFFSEELVGQSAFRTSYEGTRSWEVLSLSHSGFHYKTFAFPVFMRVVKVF